MMQTQRKSMWLSIVLLSFWGLQSAAQSGKELSLGDLADYEAHKTTEKIQVDGKLDETVWRKCEARSLDYFYAVEKPTDMQQTKVRVLWDDETIYVAFECADQFITAREKTRDNQPYFDDCAEVFLIPAGDSLKMHYGFEVNLYQSSNDFIYLNDVLSGNHMVAKSYNPDFSTGVTVDGTINDNSDIDKGWIMEFAIPLYCLRTVNMTPCEAGIKWAFMAVRQDRNDPEGNRRSTSTISPIYDDGVHAPNRFSFLKFVE